MDRRQLVLWNQWDQLHDVPAQRLEVFGHGASLWFPTRVTEGTSPGRLRPSPIVRIHCYNWAMTDEPRDCVPCSLAHSDGDVRFMGRSLGLGARRSWNETYTASIGWGLLHG